ncbi:SDR family NAD(P)-dependent oxidoreductase [Thermoactinomyces mirandus]|uniref:SDR family oxidoreductase n=1 Tax=Thermoactinomyces mirandus TaxID=2756294 RepID=A0A7W1XRH3_9BACL|nr:SDR family oxidoreductase [Thermoactinomyces mirandus]MBA4601947.1 SDR family oxidoreductase [Thermoactinomyces mirandus]
MSEPIVLITGASSGIGEAIARKLAVAGYFPILTARNLARLHQLQQELNKGAVLSCDITREEDVKKLIDQIIQKFGRIDILINSAGYGRFGDALDISLEDYQGMMETNFLGTVRMIHHVLPHMLENGGGRIINISSMAGLTGIPNLAGYCATKFALIGFSESLRLEYSPAIQVGVLCPGPVRTPFFGEEDPNHHFPSLIARQMLDAEDVALETLKMIQRPRIVIIPKKLKWALKLRHWFPSLFLALTKQLYSRLNIKNRKSTFQHISKS